MMMGGNSNINGVLVQGGLTTSMTEEPTHHTG